MVTITVFINNAFPSRAQFETIYLDIRQAFDSVSHFHLLSKLYQVAGFGYKPTWVICFCQ